MRSETLVELELVFRAQISQFYFFELILIIIHNKAVVYSTLRSEHNRNNQ